MGFEEFSKYFSGSKKGPALELYTLKELMNNKDNVQQVGWKKYNLTDGFTTLILYLDGKKKYEQDVVLFAEHELGKLKKFHRFLWGIKTTHATQNIAIQCKNYGKSVDYQHIDEDLSSVGVWGIVSYNIPVSTVIIKDENVGFEKYKFKKTYHVLDVVKNSDFNTEYLEKSVLPKGRNKYIALKDFGRFTLEAHSFPNITDVSLSQIKNFINKQESELLEDEIKSSIGNLVLALKKGRLELINVVRYSDIKHKDFVTFSDEKELRNSVVNTWRFFNPMYVVYLTVEGVSPTALQHLEDVKANAFDLETELLVYVGKGNLLKKMNKLDIDLEFGIGARILGDAQQSLMDIAHDLTTAGYKKLNFDAVKKVIKKFLTKKKFWSNTALRI
ncbi:MAG: hypothetical protein JW791_00520 [Nanoarchaeota archaeon]|nr:hypothetical protein [Nanoarchaeota archaeon]